MPSLYGHSLVATGNFSLVGMDILLKVRSSQRGMDNYKQKIISNNSSTTSLELPSPDMLNCWETRKKMSHILRQPIKNITTQSTALSQNLEYQLVVLTKGASLDFRYKVFCKNK